ncbi:MAG: ABC transporter permease, partial [Candidatus Aminicenantes bacterium]|nr:ABC transporter permease [Candidatus Aminicenantes bacterium]
MFKNYTKTAIRHIQRQKLYSLINISGLAVSLICCMLILLWVHDEWSYDRFHTNADQIYRAIITDSSVGMDKSLAVTPIPLAPTIKNEIPEVIHATRVLPSEMRFIFHDSRFDERGLFVSSDFFEMFFFPFIQGDPEKIKTDLNTIAISEKTAKKIFGTNNPIGQTLGTERGSEFLITGVFQDIPSQSHIKPDYLMNFRHLEQMGRDLNRWMDVSFYTYLMLDKNANVQNVIQKITECHNSHLPDLKVNYQLQPLKQIYLDPPYMYDNIALHGSRQSVII